MPRAGSVSTQNTSSWTRLPTQTIVLVMKPWSLRASVWAALGTVRVGPLQAPYDGLPRVERGGAPGDAGRQGTAPVWIGSGLRDSGLCGEARVQGRRWGEAGRRRARGLWVCPRRGGGGGGGGGGGARAPKKAR